MAFNDYHKVVLFGDSITEQSYEQTRGFGFGAAMTDVYRRKLEVVCRGFSGYTTAHALHALPQIIPEPSEKSRIKLMMVFFGANDAVLPGQPQHVPLGEYSSNLRQILTHPLLKAHGTKFILIAPPPICEYLTQEREAERGRDCTQRLAGNTRKYAEAAVQVGNSLGVPVVNLWEAFMTHIGGLEISVPLVGSKEAPRSQGLAMLLRDGLHFKPEGYEILYGEVLKTIRCNYPELEPDSLRLVFPCWERAPKTAHTSGDT